MPHTHTDTHTHTFTPRTGAADHAGDAPALLLDGVLSPERTINVDGLVRTTSAVSTMSDAGPGTDR